MNKSEPLPFRSHHNIVDPVPDQANENENAAPSGMDKKIKKSKKPLLIKSALALIAVVALVVVGHRVLTDASVSTFRVDKDHLSINAVSYGFFEDFIPVRGTVTPLKSVYLDAVEGGRVEKVFVEEGSIVEEGQPILELSNTNLQLEVISREAQVSEQLNNLRNTRLAMEQNKLSLKTQLVELDYQIKRLQRLVERQKQLVDKKMISTADFEDTLDQLEYQIAKREVTIESQKQDDQMRLAQIESLADSVTQLEKNLEIAKKNLENLIVKAPVSGQLTSLNAEIGQSKARGETLGQIDDTERYKLSVLIDEFYVSRTRVGQYGEFTLAGTPYELRVSKVYPEIVSGQFRVDMDFVDAVPTNIRRGQTLQTRVQLGDATEALLLPRGGFFQDTGGNWVFVVNAENDAATKRDIRLGRRNPEYFEVLEGLQEGDKVITSEYAAYKDIDRIKFN